MPARRTRTRASPAAVVAATRAWIERAVIGLNLCPFAKSVYVREQIRYVVSSARTRAALRADLARELRTLVAADPAKIDTTLLIHPRVLVRFADYNDFLDDADELLAQLDLTGVIQIASFHPRYRFAGVAAHDVSNHTNRSPYPMLHLLREASVAQAVDGTPDPDGIHRRNVETMRRLGIARLVARGIASSRR